MGNYVFTADVLVEALEKDAAEPDSRHDMGGDIIPMLVEQGRAAVYDFKRNVVPGATDRDRDYWRDVGTLDSYHEAHLDLVSTCRSSTSTTPSGRSSPRTPSCPARSSSQDASVRDSIVCAGSIVSGGERGQLGHRQHDFVGDGA